MLLRHPRVVAAVCVALACILGTGLSAEDTNDALPKHAVARCGYLNLRPAIFAPLAAFSPKGDIVATTVRSEDGVDLWDAASGVKIRSHSIADKIRQVTEIGFSPDGRKLAIAGYINRGKDQHKQYALSVWDIGSGTSLQVPESGSVSLPDPGVVFAFSPDGQSLACSIQVGVIQIVSANDGTSIKSLRYEPAALADTLRFSADGRRIAAAGNHWLRIWDVASEKILVSANAVYATSEAARRSREQQRKDLPVWWPARPIWPDQLRWKWEDLPTKQSSRIVHQWPPARLFSGTAFSLSPDLSMVAYWNGNLVRLCRTSNGNLIREIKRDDVITSTVTFSPDGKQIALETKAYENAIRLVDITTGQVQNVLRSHGTMARDISFSADGSKLLATTEFRVYVWDVNLRRLLPYLDGHEVVTKVAFSPDGRFVASEGLDQVIDSGSGKKLPLPTAGDGVRVWDARTGKERFNFGPCHGLLFTPDTKELLAWKNDGIVDVHDLQSGKIVESIQFKAWDGKSPKTRFNPIQGEIPLTSNISDVQITADGATLVYLIGGRQIAFFERRQKKVRFLPPINVENNYSPILNSLSISSDATKLLCIQYSDQDGFGQGDYRFLVLNSATGKCEVEYKPKNRNVSAAIFSPDAKLVAAWPDSVDDVHEPPQIHIVEAETGRLVRSILLPRRDDTRFFGFRFQPRPLAFSPKSRLLASAGHDSKVCVWDVESGRKLRELAGHLGQVTSLAFSNDGNKLASGSFDSTVMVWDARNATK